MRYQYKIKASLYGKFKVKNILKAVILNFFLVGLATSQSVFKCDVDGKVIFTDQPCEGETFDASAIGSVYSSGSLPQSMSKLGKVYSHSNWLYDYRGYKKALKLSQKYDAPIFIYFHADWCGYCRKLERELIDKRQTKKILKEIVKVKINPESSSDAQSLFENLGGTGYPSILIQKSFDSQPKKYHLMKKKYGKWKTMSIKEFSQLISAI
jgi:thiol-disulfide isomerase/thioredoxin